MNRVACTISSIKTDEHIALISLESAVCGELRALVINQNLPYKIGQKVWALFRQTQTCILKSADSQSTNIIKSRIAKIHKGGILSLVELENNLRAILPECKSLQVGESVCCLIAPSEIMLELDSQKGEQC